MSESRKPWRTVIGIGLLAGVFGLALVNVLRLSLRESADESQIIRIGHYQLESGAREALQAVIEEYQALYPNAQVVQGAVPERMFPTWLKTQLVGGTPPDIIQLGREQTGSFEDTYANYFEPIGDWLRAPNPYNARSFDPESPLEDEPWINTFIDGLERGASYSGALMEHYGVPSTIFTVRIFYNRQMVDAVLQGAPLPADFSGFIELCERLAQQARQADEPIVPIAGSRAHAPPLIQALWDSQTQQLFLGADPLPMLRVSFPEFYGSNALLKRWSFDSPQVLSAYSAMREVGRYMPPGFLQLERDDSLFLFSQGRAAFLVTGSQDARSLEQQCPFPIGVMSLPYPSADDGRYGQFAVGNVSEGGVSTQFVLGITRASRQKEAAIDFLRFLTSRRMNRLFSETAQWLPVIVSVTPPEGMEAFAPNLEGYPPGPHYLFPGPETAFLLQTNFHVLMRAEGSVEAFAQNIGRGFEAAIRSDVIRANRSNDRMTARMDSVFAARYWQGLRQPGPRDRRHILATQIQATRETRRYRVDYELWLVDQASPQP